MTTQCSATCGSNCGRQRPRSTGLPRAGYDSRRPDARMSAPPASTERPSGRRRSAGRSAGFPAAHRVRPPPPRPAAPPGDGLIPAPSASEIAKMGDAVHEEHRSPRRGPVGAGRARNYRQLRWSRSRVILHAVDRLLSEHAAIHERNALGAGDGRENQRMQARSTAIGSRKPTNRSKWRA